MVGGDALLVLLTPSSVGAVDRSQGHSCAANISILLGNGFRSEEWALEILGGVQISTSRQPSRTTRKRLGKSLGGAGMYNKTNTN